jgi:hypothetical protein
MARPKKVTPQAGPSVNEESTRPLNKIFNGKPTKVF